MSWNNYSVTIPQYNLIGLFFTPALLDYSKSTVLTEIDKTSDFSGKAWNAENKMVIRPERRILL